MKIKSSSFVGVFIGLWLIFSPWILGFSHLNLVLWNNIILGSLVLLLTLWNSVK